ncbi:MAG: Ty1/Copia family ribonuclease HI, partial [bacterium]
MSTSIYVDADHARDKQTRRSHTGLVAYVQNAPVLWLSKRQSTVESSTHGAELVATRVGVEMVEALRYKLRMFGIP